MNFNDKNYYEILEINITATQEEVRAAYKKARNAYSTDSVALYSLISQEECESILEQVEEAYSIIGDPLKRKEYNKARGLEVSDKKTLYNKSYDSNAINPRGSRAGNSSLDQSDSQQKSNTEISSRSFNRPEMLDSHSHSTPTEDYSYANNDKDFQYNSDHAHKKNVTIPKISAYNKFKLNFNSDESIEQSIENCSEFTGEFLKKIREYKNVTVERMSDMIKISKTYIRHIEDEEFEKLPAVVYTRGFVFQYAKFLKLNPDLVATSYMHRLRQLKDAAQRES